MIEPVSAENDRFVLCAVRFYRAVNQPFGLAVHIKGGALFDGDGCTFRYHDAVVDEIGLFCRKRCVIGKSYSSFQYMRILSVGFEQDGLSNAVCDKYDLIIYDKRRIFVVRFDRHLDHYIKAVFFPDRYVAEQIAFTSVHIYPEVAS